MNSEYRDKRKDGIKRVIANMTVGKDVSALFPDVLKNMQTEDLEQKKLVYLYLMNYAKTQPELVILAVNTFVKDTEDPNALIRALAIRTMGCLRAEKIIDYLPDPLERCLDDDNPYVRKTAVICVAKLFNLKPELALERGFVDRVKAMIADNNPMVVANAVAALNDAFVHSHHDRDVHARLVKAQKLLKQSKSKDYYKTLGVARDADERTIKKAYRRLAREHHPDKGGSQEKMAEINEAFGVLGDAELRARYDQGDDPNDPTGGQANYGDAYAHGDAFQQMFQNAAFQQFARQHGGQFGGGGAQFHWGF